MQTNELELVLDEEVPNDLRLAISAEMPDFEEIILTRKKLLAKVNKFTPVTDPEDTPRMAEAKEIRLGLVKCRTGLERIRKAAGETARKRVDAINEMFRAWREDNEKHEEFLKESEEFGIRYEAARKAELQKERAAILVQWTSEPYPGLGELTTAQWEITLAGAKAAKETANKAAQEAAAKAAEEAAERERLRTENQRLLEEQAKERAAAEAERQKAAAALRAEQEKAAAEAAAVKAAADAVLREEQEKARKIAAEAQAKLDAERREKERLEQAERTRLAAEKAAAEKAARAPDKVKLLAFLKDFEDGLPAIPTVQGEALLALDTFTTKMMELLGQFQEQVERL